MNETTVARVAVLENAHWYSRNGEPCHTVIAKGTGRPRPTTVADARKMGLLPSVTSIQKILAKPQLESWKIEQACLALLTAPRRKDEQDDAFVKRVLQDEKQQDEVRDAAADLGTRIHAAIALGLEGKPFDAALKVHVHPALDWVKKAGITPTLIEQTIVGDGYAGTVDLRGTLGDGLVLVDWKSTNSVPKDKPWDDHPVQVGAYAVAWLNSLGEIQKAPLRCFVGYISTKEPGVFKVFEVEDWVEAYDQEFMPSLSIWIRRKGYNPREEATAEVAEKMQVV
jgi:hypothetical protein